METEKTALLFKALGDENRLRILKLVSQGEDLCACRILDELDITQPTLSHHMKILKDAGLISARKQGRWMHYSISENAINKGVESVFDSKLVNRYIPENERPVPFKHMIYVGDGTTDIPCMRLVKNSGGHSIAVYNPDRKGASKEMASLIHDNRVSHVCPADYTEGSEMDILVKTIIDKIDLDDRLEKLEVVR